VQSATLFRRWVLRKQMRRKRFKHQVYVLCHMFCGWQLYADYERLARLTKGDLHINVLTKECCHNGRFIEPLNIASVLNKWIIDDMRSHNIPSEAVSEATLGVSFQVSRNPKSRKGVTIIDHNFHCKGKIRSGDDIYLARFQDLAGAQSLIEKAS
jgi:hypothetical protein